MVDEVRTVAEFIGFLEALKLAPADDHELKIWMKNGSKVHIRIAVDEIGDRLTLACLNRRFSLIPGISEDAAPLPRQYL